MIQTRSEDTVTTASKQTVRSAPAAWHPLPSASAKLLLCVWYVPHLILSSTGPQWLIEKTKTKYGPSS